MQLTAARLLFSAMLGALTAAVLSASAPGAPQPPEAAPQLLPTIPLAPDENARLTNPVPGQGKDGEKKDGGADEEKKNGEVKETTPDRVIVDVGPALSLGECIAIAIERQPNLKAVMASGAATTAGYNALQKIGRVGSLLSPDLDIRKQQAQRGLAASAADYQKAHNEVVQDVTRLYYSAVYAKQAEAIASQVAGQLKELIAIAKVILANEVNPKNLDGLTKGKILAMEVGLREVQQKVAEARIGRRQAMAALRQLMAVDEQSFPFHLKDTQLPLMAQKVPVVKELVVELAVGRRPELALAAAGVDAFRLEVYAQGKIQFMKVVPTFASGSDIHAKEIPHAVRTKEYRPGAVSPELPPQLVGSKFDRVCRAMAYSKRAESLYDSARSLIVLEAENTYLEFELATDKVSFQQEKLDLAIEIQKLARQEGPNTKDKSVIVQAEVMAAKAEADYLEAVYQHLLALAAMERVTAGGIRPAFPGR